MEINFFLEREFSGLAGMLTTYLFLFGLNFPRPAPGNLALLLSW